jgi:hypothetical protein
MLSAFLGGVSQWYLPPGAWSPVSLPFFQSGWRANFPQVTTRRNSEEIVKLKPARILLATMTLGALCLVSEASRSALTGHFGGGHFGGGGGHFGGGHFGGGGGLHGGGRGHPGGGFDPGPFHPGSGFHPGPFQ